MTHSASVPLLTCCALLVLAVGSWAQSPRLQVSDNDRRPVSEGEHHSGRMGRLAGRSSTSGGQ